MDSAYDDISEALVPEERIPTLDSADEEVPDECDESADEVSDGNVRDSFIADTTIAKRSSTMKEARKRASFHF